ncbi:hypothetical protein N7490_011518 [Penicillium lividum]|nr:hypothetical protein N7490_011518 [Penicillium lividum]
MNSGSARDYYYPNERDSYRDPRDSLPHKSHHREHSHISASGSGSSHSHGHRHGHSNHKTHYKKSTENRDPHHNRHLIEGAVAAVGVAETIHHHRKKEGEDVSSGFGHILRTVGAGALGAVAANEIERAHNSHRSKSPRSSNGYYKR